MRVVTFNTALIQPNKRCWSCLPTRSVDAIIDRVLRFKRCDVVMLQEVYVQRECTRIVEQVTEVWGESAYDEACGLLILSKAFIQHEEVKRFGRLDKGALCAQIGGVSVCNVHLSSVSHTPVARLHYVSIARRS